MKNLFLAATAFSAFAALSPPAFAELVYNSSISVSGTGLGAVTTLVTGHQSPTPPGTEDGCIIAGATVTTTVDQCAPSFNYDGTLDNQTGTGGVQNISSLGGTGKGGDLVLVWNISETGQDVSANLQDLYLEIASSNGTTFYAYLDPTIAGTAYKQGTGTGLGGSGFVFTLDSAEAAAATLFTNTNCGAGKTCVVAGGFSAFNTDDGNETLFVTSIGNPGVVPEPASIFLFGTIALVTGSAIRRRRHARSV